MHKVIHLLPYDGIGGAEEAARSMVEAPVDDLDFRLRYLFPRVTSSRQRHETFNPFPLLASVRDVLREKPDLLVVSLWRSCIVGLLVKLLRPRVRLAVMIHNSVDAHAGDFVFTRMAMALADAIWSDSEASMRMRFRRKPRAPVAVIPFLTRRLAPLDDAVDPPPPGPHFIFWGRLAAQKNLWLALRVFQAIHRIHPDASYTIIGPDSGELAALQDWCARSGLSSVVRFAGPLDFPQICKQALGRSFYLQTSDYEGMAMSVVEAMQLGLVPVVTPVGEIGRYCSNGNAVLVGNADQAVADVRRLIDDADTWRDLRRRALATWREQPMYRDAFAAECRKLLLLDGC